MLGKGGPEAESKREGMRLGKYELGRTLGEGNFGKVKYARDIESGLAFAVKILDKNRILDLKIVHQVIISFPFHVSLFFLSLSLSPRLQIPCIFFSCHPSLLFVSISPCNGGLFWGQR